LTATCTNEFQDELCLGSSAAKFFFIKYIQNNRRWR